MRTPEKPRPRSDRLHIFVASRLCNQPAQRWESILRQLEEDRNIMRSVYAPLRMAVNKELRDGGGAPFLDRLLERMERTPNLESIKANSRQALQIFISAVKPHISGFVEDYMTGRTGNVAFSFHGATLEGAFHAKVELRKGGEKLVYVHPSTWGGAEEAAFIELLAIMAEECYGMTRKDIWFLDLKAGVIRRPHPTGVRLRQELAATVRHYLRLQGS